MKVGFLIFTCLACVLCLSNCTPSHLSEKELTQYVLDPDNGLVQENAIGDIQTKVIYRPTDLLVEQEAGDQPTEAEIKKLRDKYNKYHYFILSLSKNNKEIEYQSGGMGEFSELVQTLSFRMGQYVQLISENDTIPVGDYTYSRTYGLGNASTMLFAFSKEKTKDKKWLEFYLDDFGLRTGRQRFRFKTKDVEGAPQIDFQNVK